MTDINQRTIVEKIIILVNICLALICIYLAVTALIDAWSQFFGLQGSFEQGGWSGINVLILPIMFGFIGVAAWTVVAYARVLTRSGALMHLFQYWLCTILFVPILMLPLVFAGRGGGSSINIGQLVLAIGLVIFPTIFTVFERKRVETTKLRG